MILKSIFVEIWTGFAQLQLGHLLEVQAHRVHTIREIFLFHTAVQTLQSPLNLRRKQDIQIESQVKANSSLSLTRKHNSRIQFQQKIEVRVLHHWCYVSSYPIFNGF